MYDRDAILAATDLAALADELLGPHAGNDAHPKWCCPSPQHAQTGRTPPVSVFTSRWDEERWHCHGCGDGGTAIDLVMRTRNVGTRDALAELAGRARIPSSQAAPLDPPSGRLVSRLAARRRAIKGPGQVNPLREAEIEAYVEACAEELWGPGGAAARRWLLDKRGLSEAVLRANRVGADLGRPSLPRPHGCCRHSGAVILPVHQDGSAVYFQARVLHPLPDRPRYLNPTADVAPNPKVSAVAPAELRHPEIIVTEGAIDALSAASAGYRAAAVLSAGYPDRYVALQLSRLDGPLVLAMDADPAGQGAATQLAGHLEALQRPPDVLPLETGDLNEALQLSGDWPHELADRIHTLRPAEPTDQPLGVDQ